MHQLTRLMRHVAVPIFRASYQHSVLRGSTIVAVQQSRGFARSRGSNKGSDTVEAVDSLEKVEHSSTSLTPPPPKADPWTPVSDKESGLVYWWNQETNETTAVGAPKPGSPESDALLVQQQQQQELAAQQAQPQQPGLGRVMAEGASFGVGMGIARAAVGSLFGLGGGDDGGDGGDWL